MEKTIHENHDNSSPRDTFLQLWSIASLYVSAGAFLTLMFQYINYFFPDIANPYSFSDDAVRWSTALLIVIFPAHLIVMRIMQRDYVADPKKRVAKLRKWLMYLTLFVAAAAFIVDIAVLVFEFLSGELSLRSLLKIAVVAVTAGGIFWYYISDIQRPVARLPKSVQAAIVASVAIVGLAIIGAFFVSGSPFEARYQKIDRARVEHLQVLQYQIIDYWQHKNRLPQALEELRDDISGFVPPLDPETSAVYEYEVRGPLTFALCATFDRETVVDGKTTRPIAVEPYSVEEHWRHASGRTCFERMVDPERYPPLPDAPPAKTKL